MGFEYVFAVVQVVVTEIIAVFFKDSIIPSRFIPLVNLGVGIIAAVVAIVMGIFNDIPTAIITSLGLAFAVGGIYDTINGIANKE